MFGDAPCQPVLVVKKQPAQFEDTAKKQLFRETQGYCEDSDSGTQVNMIGAQILGAKEDKVTVETTTILNNAVIEPSNITNCSSQT